MSRIIPDKQTVHLSPEEHSFRNSDTGKIIFTDYQGRGCAAFLKNNRLLAAGFPEENQSKIGAVYMGKVQKVLSNINACFIEITAGEICFLSLKDATFPLLQNRSFDGRVLQGDEFPVEIIRDAQKTKQASVTAKLTVSNEYFVLEFGSQGVHYSTKLSAGEKKSITDLLQKADILTSDSGNSDSLGCSERLECSDSFLASLPSIPRMQRIPTGMIVRTKAKDLPEKELLEAFTSLAEEYRTLLQTASHMPCFGRIRQSQNPYETFLSQMLFPEEYTEIITDNASLYDELSPLFAKSFPEKPFRLYRDNMLSLSKLYSLETKMKEALSERVWLKSGSYLIIQPTEALTVIDVNSGKYESNKRREEYFLTLNQEAAREIALQLRLRNLSGIIVIDFINLTEETSRQILLQTLKDEVKKDKMPVTVVDITPLGLVEITRKKENMPLLEQYRRFSGS